VSRRTAIAAAVLAALLGVVAWRYFASRAHEAVGTLIAGGDGGRLPRASPGAEGFDEPVLQSAAAFAAKQGARALLVMRHGHLVLEQYGGGADADTLFDGGELARAVLLLATGVAVDRNGMPIPDTTHIDSRQLAAAIAHAGGEDYPAFLSRHLWRPLDAAPARWLDPGMRARASDWMRVAGLLLHDGRFEGTQVVPVGWIARLGAPRGPVGAEPFRQGEAFMFHGGATLLWLVPHADLAILYVDGSPAAGFALDETRLPRMILRALREQGAAGGARLDELVPGH
jgi:CubicO group peptidase (beta-lactamase class C family)